MAKMKMAISSMANGNQKCVAMNLSAMKTSGVPANDNSNYRMKANNGRAGGFNAIEAKSEENDLGEASAKHVK